MSEVGQIREKNSEKNLEVKLGFFLGFQLVGGFGTAITSSLMRHRRVAREKQRLCKNHANSVCESTENKLIESRKVLKYQHFSGFFS
jgi:hypothetical protein